MQAPNNAGKHARVIAAIILTTIGIVGSVKLKLSSVISEPTLVIFVAFSLVLGLVIAVIERIESFSLRSLGVKLREIRETEASIKELGKAIHDVFETKSFAIMDESYDADAADAAMAKLKTLIGD
jgi:hypothetical protein